MIVDIIESNGNKWVDYDSFKQYEKDNVMMSDALLWCEEYFLSRDRMNAKIHCAPLRLSPITERILWARGKNPESIKR